MGKDRVNTKRGERLKGKITPLEVQAFKHRIKVGSQLRCYRPHGGSDEKNRLERMTVTALFPHIVVLSYQGAYRKMYETSMTWAEAIQLNRLTQEEFTCETEQMYKETGLTLSKKHRRAPKNHYAGWKEKASVIESYRNKGMTFKQIAAAVGCSASTARTIFREEVQHV